MPFPFFKKSSSTATPAEKRDPQNTELKRTVKPSKKQKRARALHRLDAIERGTLQPNEKGHATATLARKRNARGLAKRRAEKAQQKRMRRAGG